MFKRIFFCFLLSVCVLMAAGFVFAKSPVEIDFFFKQGCPHCQDEEVFLRVLEDQYKDQIKINGYSVLDSNGVKVLKDLCQKYNIEKCLGVVPVTFVESDFFLGFDNQKGVGLDIENAIKKNLALEQATSSQGIYVPIIGRVDFSKHSFLGLAALLGFFDGFNVCSLGALVLILSLVLALKSRKKVLILGGTFIIVTAAIYGALILLWYKIFSVFENYLGALQVFIGIVSLVGAWYFFKQFLKFKKMGPACDMANQSITAKLSERVAGSLQKQLNIFILIGIILFFAAAITIVEFPCSAALPLVFAATLTNAGVSTGAYLFYLAMYLFFYLLDELVVFVIASITMKIWIASNKFVIWSALAGSILLIAMAAYYILGLILPLGLFTPR